MKRTALLFVALFAVPAVLPAATKTWSGAVNGNWSNGGNWSGGTAPVAGDDLVFVASPNVITNNDLPAGTAFQSITVSSGNFIVNGNSFVLNAGMSVTGSGSMGLLAPIALGGSQTWSGGTGLSAPAPLNLGSYTLTITGGSYGFMAAISGTGGLVVNGSANLWTTNTYTGPTIVNASGSLAACVIPGPVTVSGNFFFGQPLSPSVVPKIGPFTSTGGTVEVIDAGGATGNFSLDSTTQFNVTSQSTSRKPLSVTGSVSLGNAHLTFSPSYTPPTGTIFTIIDNDGSDPVVGTFAGLPEGARITPTRQISYRGGDGNDVTITIVPPQTPTSTTLAANPNPVLAGLPVTLAASVTAASGPLSGIVTFYDQATAIGSAALAGSTATITTSFTPGSHTLSATFAPSTTDFTGSTSGTVVEIANQLSTATSLTAFPNPTYAGDTTSLTAIVTASSATPTGSVTFYNGANALATQLLAAGSATVTVGPLPRGVQPMTATYVPNVAGFTTSTSPVVMLTVMLRPAATTTTLVVAPGQSVRGQSVTMTATVACDTGSPVGSVIFADGDETVDSEPVTAGTASFSTSALSTGEHTLKAFFLPSSMTLFAPSASEAVTHKVLDTAIRRRAAEH